MWLAHQVFLLALIRLFFLILSLWLLVLWPLALLAWRWLRGSIAPIIYRFALGLGALTLRLEPIVYRAAIDCWTIYCRNNSWAATTGGLVRKFDYPLVPIGIPTWNPTWLRAIITAIRAAVIHLRHPPFLLGYAHNPMFTA